MKFLIWFLCIFANALIATLIKETGVILGAIPTVVLYGATIWLSRTLCKKWDEHKENKEAARKAQSHPSPQPTSIKVTAPQTTPVKMTASDPIPHNPNNDKICFCRKCGEKLIDGSKFCRKCGTEVVELPQ